MDTNIWVAASDGHLASVQRFVAEGVDIDSQDDNGYSPLHAAASYGHLELMQWLLDNGAKVDARDAEGTKGA